MVPLTGRAAASATAPQKTTRTLIAGWRLLSQSERVAAIAPDKVAPVIAVPQRTRGTHSRFPWITWQIQDPNAARTESTLSRIVRGPKLGVRLVIVRCAPRSK